MNNIGVKHYTVDFFVDKYCYDAVKKNAFTSTSELTTIINNNSSTQLSTKRGYILYPESTTTGSNNITRQNDVTTNNDKEYVINNLIYNFYLFN